MTGKKTRFLLLVIVWLCGCADVDMLQVTKVAQLSIRQMEESRGQDFPNHQDEEIIKEVATIGLESATIRVDIQKKDNPLEEIPSAGLTENEKEDIQILVTAYIYATPGKMEQILVDHKMLEANAIEDELNMQMSFITCIYNETYAAQTRKILTDVVENIDENEMSLTWEQVAHLLRMAGAEPSEGLQSYAGWNPFYQEGHYRIAKFYNIGEIFKEVDFEAIRKGVDGKVYAEGIVRLEYDYGAVRRFKVTLVPNNESVFKYSVGHIREELIHPGSVGVIGSDPLLDGSYGRPNEMSNNPFDYIFELEGALYKMPFPAGELEHNGWKLEEQGNLEAGARTEIHVSKEGKTLTAGLWNYHVESSVFQDCQVVWLKTGRDKAFNGVRFKLAEGVESGMKEQEIEYLYRDYMNGSYTSYGRTDALYRNQYGYLLHFKDGLVYGFEMGYAPTPIEREKRILLMTGSWEQAAKSELSPGMDVELAQDHIYQLDINGDSVKEEICIRELNGIKWAGYTCVFMDGDINYMVRGLASHQVHCSAIKMVKENGDYFLIFEGWDYATEFSRKIKLEQGWSKEVALGLPNN